MLDKPSQAPQLMAKDTSSINILTCVSYIRKNHQSVPYERLFKGILANDKYRFMDEDSGEIKPVDQKFLLDAKNWVSNQVLNKVYQNAVLIMNDPDAVYQAGRQIFKTAVGAQVMLMRLAGVQTIISRLPKENAKFNRNRTIEVVENRNGFAVVRINWKNSPDITKLFCDMNRGVYEGMGKLTKNPAIIEEAACQFDGAEYCEYHIKWKAKPFYARLWDQLRYAWSREIIEALENKIEEINHIRVRQERIIKSRTRDLQAQKETVERAYNILSRYVPPQLVQKILDGQIEPVWGHSRKKLTMFFSDIKDFTQTTDAMEPEDMARLLNAYISNMYAIIKRYGGTLAHIIGDALLVFFGAPDATNDHDHALKCVRMAIEMQQKMRQLQQEWFDNGIEYPLQIRCGINTGMATVGGYGSRERKEYTAMGMQVNLAARLESACRPGQILISHPCWALVKEQIPSKPMGKIEVKGFARPVRVYQVLFEAPRQAAVTM